MHTCDAPPRSTGPGDHFGLLGQHAIYTTAPSRHESLRGWGGSCLLQSHPDTDAVELPPTARAPPTGTKRASANACPEPSHLARCRCCTPHTPPSPLPHLPPMLTPAGWWRQGPQPAWSPPYSSPGAAVATPAIPAACSRQREGGHRHGSMWSEPGQGEPRVRHGR